MTLFIFTSSRELLRAAWEKWHPTADCDEEQQAEAHVGGRLLSVRFATALRSAGVRDAVPDLPGHN